MDRWKSAELLDKYDKRISRPDGFCIVGGSGIYYRIFQRASLCNREFFPLPDKKYLDTGRIIHIFGKAVNEKQKITVILTFKKRL